MSGRFVSARFRELGPSGTDQAIGIFSGHLDDAVLSDDDKPAPASSAEGPKVRRLAAGGNKIRTIGSAGEGPDASCVGSLSLRLFGLAGTNQRRLERLVVSRGTDGSNPVPSSGESITNSAGLADADRPARPCQPGANVIGEQLKAARSNLP